MGHISNPIGFRLGLSRAWKVKASSPRYNYQEDVYNQVSQIIHTYFGSRSMERKAIIYSHTLVKFTTFKTIFCNVFLYDARFELNFAKYYTAFFKRIRKVRAKRANNLSKPLLKQNSPLLTITNNFYKRRFNFLMRHFMYYTFRNPWINPFTHRIKQNVAHSFKFPNCLDIKIQPFSNSTITAKTIGIYAVRKLNAKNSLNSIFKPIMRYISLLFAGFRVICRGRFTRNQRATLSIFNFGTTKLSTFSSDIDYYQADTALKYV
jgi:hypothetical protein